MDIEQRLLETDALLQGHFILSSGLHSDKYVQCARLLQYPEYAREAGEALAARIKEFRPNIIVSPAIGGLIIGHETAEALSIPHIFVEKKDGKPLLRRGFEVEKGQRIVIVEDVVTTGLSAMEVVKVIEHLGAEVVAMASIINRSGRENPFDRDYRNLFSLGLEVYEPSECPLCSKGIEAIKPGSRPSK